MVPLGKAEARAATLAKAPQHWTKSLNFRPTFRAITDRPPVLNPAGRRRTRNFCVPSSTSSLRWLNTVLSQRHHAGGAARHQFGHLERRIDGVAGVNRLEEPARLFEEADQRFLDHERKQAGARARCGPGSGSHGRAGPACRGRGNIRRRNGSDGCRRSRSGTPRTPPRSGSGSGSRSARRARNPQTSVARAPCDAGSGSKSVMSVSMRACLRSCRYRGAGSCDNRVQFVDARACPGHPRP